MLLLARPFLSITCLSQMSVVWFNFIEDNVDYDSIRKRLADQFAKKGNK